jgi:hypothetical protein
MRAAVEVWERVHGARHGVAVQSSRYLCARKGLMADTRLIVAMPSRRFTAELSTR